MTKKQRRAANGGKIWVSVKDCEEYIATNKPTGLTLCAARDYLAKAPKKEGEK